MVKDHSDSERGNPLPARHGLLFLITYKLNAFYFIRYLSTVVITMGLDNYIITYLIYTELICKCNFSF